METTSPLYSALVVMLDSEKNEEVDPTLMPLPDDDKLGRHTSRLKVPQVSPSL